jgi:hypothetical protein
MAEAPTAAMTAILTLIIIVVVVLLMYTLAPDTFAQITGIADEVFNAEKYEAEEIETLIEAAYTQFFTDIDDCEEVREEKEQSSCYCKSTTLKDLPEGSYFNFENEYSTSLTVTALTDEGVPIEQDKKEYVLGLFAIVEEGNKKALGCLYPDNYFVFAKDEGGPPGQTVQGGSAGQTLMKRTIGTSNGKTREQINGFMRAARTTPLAFTQIKGKGQATAIICTTLQSFTTLQIIVTAYLPTL